MDTSEKPLYFESSEKVEEFLNQHSYITVVDAFDRQLKELFFIDNHSFIGQDKEEVYKTDDFKKYTDDKKDDFIHVYFPWNHHLIKTVKADNYYRLKTNRNDGLISPDLQKKLRDYKVAVLGMSVGSNIAFVMTQAGISNKIVLADFDELDTTNLNRILAGAHQIGINKTIIAARRIYEDNPFAEVTLLKDGVNEDNLEELLKAGKIDCIVEEIDDMPFKIHARLLAIKYKKAVLMVTDNGDGVVLHVERYDLGNTKIWGKDVEYFKKKLAAGPFTKEMAGKMIIGDIVGGPDKVDPNMMMAVPRVISKELVSWPQLGSAAILGGVVVTAMLKKVVSGESTDLDIRSYISPTDITHSTHA